MIKALTSAQTGLEAQQSNIERISNDLANVNTDGYKRSRTEFEDLMYETVREPGEETGAGSQTPVGVQVGRGVKVGATHKIHEQGPIRVTGRPFDLMIHGKGFFPIQLPDGTVAYTRTGNFYKDAEGRVVTQSGGRLIPEISVPSNALEVKVAPNGEVRAILPENQVATLGNIQLLRFQNPEGMKTIGGNIYLASAGSGNPVQGVPGEENFGVIQQGALEGSNVNVANSMVDMISTQRAYEMGTKVMTTVDKMMESTVNLK